MITSLLPAVSRSLFTTNLLLSQSRDSGRPELTRKIGRNKIFDLPTKTTDPFLGCFVYHRVHHKYRWRAVQSECMTRRNVTSCVTLGLSRVYAILSSVLQLTYSTCIDVYPSVNKRISVLEIRGRRRHEVTFVCNECTEKIRKIIFSLPVIGRVHIEVAWPRVGNIARDSIRDGHFRRAVDH